MQHSVYPRWRGEHGKRAARLKEAYGLSPLARGTHQSQSFAAQPQRFIPAGAGNTSSGVDTLYCVSVYPRWRGEHFTLVVVEADINGLSPLARGTRWSLCVMMYYARFIPAGAGNTDDSVTITGETPVYPRWRGEHYGAAIQRATQGGLSPLARGTLLLKKALQTFCRFIPAGAGNTQKSGEMRARSSVYPRWRGEHGPLSTLGDPPHGLSPLARGTRPLTDGINQFGRFIPAGAGNTIT